MPCNWKILQLYWPMSLLEEYWEMVCLKMESLQYLSSSVIFYHLLQSESLLSPPNFYIEALTFNMMIFQGFGEAIRIRWSREGVAVMMGLVLSVAFYGHWMVTTEWYQFLFPLFSAHPSALAKPHVFVSAEFISESQ